MASDVLDLLLSVLRARHVSARVYRADDRQVS
jgi:hypothetical protein